METFVIGTMGVCVSSEMGNWENSASRPTRNQATLDASLWARKSAQCTYTRPRKRNSTTGHGRDGAPTTQAQRDAPIAADSDRNDKEDDEEDGGEEIWRWPHQNLVGWETTHNSEASYRDH